MVRRTAAVLGTMLLLAACGGDPDPSPAGTPGSSATTPVAADGTGAAGDGAGDGAGVAGDGAAVDDGAAAADGPSPSNVPATTDGERATTGTTGPPPSSTTAATSPTEVAPSGQPGEACSVDGEPSRVEAAEGPRPDVALRSDAVGPLPDLVVRRINCGGGWVNLGDELPVDRPVLIWMWAPH